jgi:hypothetical protein
MSRRVFDVVVVGGELCGLAAAALLAHAGKRVALIDDGDALVRPLGDRLVPLAPTLWRMPAAGPVATLFETLGLKADARRLFGDAVGLGVVDDDDLRCVVPVGEDARVRELGRCFGAARGGTLAAALGGFDGNRRAPLLAEAATLHEDGWWWQARRARRRVAALGDIGHLDGADEQVSALWGDGSGLAPVLAQLRPFVQARGASNDRGLSAYLAATQLVAGVTATLPLGARPALHELLRNVVLSHGGEVIADRVDRVVVDGRRVAALSTSAQRTEIVPRAVVDATHARDLVTRLPASRRQAKLLAQQARVVDEGHGVAVRWLLPATHLPRGMPPTLLVLGEGGPPVLVAVHAGTGNVTSGADARPGDTRPGDTRPGDAGKGAARDERLLAVLAASPTREPDVPAATLERLLPFARPAVRASDVVDVRHLLGPLAVKEPLHPLGGRRPRTPFVNLVRAGRDLVPPLGIDGELIAARSVVALVERALPPPPP